MMATRSFETPVPNYQTNWVTSLKNMVLSTMYNTLVSELSHNLEQLLLIKILCYGLYRQLVFPWRGAWIQMLGRCIACMSACNVTRPTSARCEILAAVTMWRSACWENLTILSSNILPPSSRRFTHPADGVCTFPRGIATPCHRRR